MGNKWMGDLVPKCSYLLPKLLAGHGPHSCVQCRQLFLILYNRNITITGGFNTSPPKKCPVECKNLNLDLFLKDGRNLHQNLHRV